MIVSEVLSGLGNQMFQYAAARALSLERNTALKLDRTWFDLEIEKQTPRNYGLDPFMLQADFVGETERKFFLNPYTGRFLNRIVLKWNSMQPYYKQRVYKEPHFHFDEHFFKATSNTYLIGYWQSEKYFSKHAQHIRNDFSFRNPLSGQNENWRQLIQSSNAISLHVRRSDKRVIAPKRWFADNSKDTSDVIPNSWVRI